MKQITTYSMKSLQKLFIDLKCRSYTNYSAKRIRKWPLQIGGKNEQSSGEKKFSVNNGF